MRQSRHHTLGGSNEIVLRWTPGTSQIRRRRGDGGRSVRRPCRVAFAADDPPQSDQLWINEPYEQTLPLGTDGGEPEARTLGVGIYHDNENFTVTDGRLTVDISDLAGVADVTWPDNCTPSGTSAVCDVPVVPAIGGDYENQVFLTVRAADGAEAGAGEDHLRGDGHRRPRRHPHRAARQLRHHAHRRRGARPRHRPHRGRRGRTARRRADDPAQDHQQRQRERERVHRQAVRLVRSDGSDPVRRLHLPRGRQQRRRGDEQRDLRVRPGPGAW